MWRVLVVVVVLSLLSCADQRLVASGEGGLDAPERLSFPPTAISFPRARTVRITNRGTLARRVTPVTEGPFRAPAEVVLEPAGDVELTITFAPTAVGPHDGALVVDELVVALEGEGVLPPTCSEAHGCRSQRFDPESLSCVDVVAPDGAACMDACVEAGSCRAGVCLGRERSCDDGNRCTSDACSAEVGCVHEVVQCEVPSNPCLAARCDAQSGCQTSPVVDGTACGPASCERAQVCLSGQCRAVVPPDGFVCAPATPCQSEGRCQDRRCEQPPARVLRPAWTVTATSTDFRFRGLTDADGNRYWVECVGGRSPTCVANSRTRTGQPRFATTLTVATPDGEPFTGDQLLRAGLFVFATNASEVAAVEQATGALRWQRRLWSAPDRLVAMAADERFVWAVVERSDRTPSWAVHRVALVNGQQQVVVHTSHHERLHRLSVGTDEAFLSSRGRTPELLRVRLDGGLTTLLRSDDPVVMVSGTSVVLANDTVVSASTGMILEQGAEPTLDVTPWPGVGRDGVRFRLGRPTIDSTFIDLPPSGLVVERREAGQRATLLQTADLIATSPWLTDQTDVLFVGAGAQTVVRLVDGRDGGVRFECPLELGELQLSTETSAWSGPDLTLQAREFGASCPACLVRDDGPQRLWSPAVLLTWDLGPTAPSPANRGWVGPSGSQAGGSRAR